MEILYFHCPWRIQWSSDKSFAELIFQFPLPADESSNNIIEPIDHVYEIKIVFYDADKVSLIPSDCLYAVAVDADEGILIGEVNSLLHYLKYLTHQVRIAWFDYFHSEKKEPFAVEWNQAEYQRLKENKRQSYRYNARRLFFPNVE